MASPYDAAKAQFSLPITELDYVCSRDLVAFLTRSPKMSSDFDLRPVTRFSGMFDVSPRGFGFFMPPPNLTVLQNFPSIDTSPSDLSDQLFKALHEEEYKQCLPNLEGDDLVWLVDYLDKVLDSLEPSGAAFRKCLRELRRVCGTKGVLPASHMVLPHLLDIDDEPFASGGFADVYHGTLNGSKVCIKRVRVYTGEFPERTMKAFRQEAVTWKRLVHPNVILLLGVTSSHPLQLISHWMPGGELLKYIRKHANADRIGLLTDVAKGLCYLHSCNVIHGDLKGANILVDDSGHARIADFGLAVVTKNPDSIQSAQHGHTLRWAAPEVVANREHSKEGDMFSFSMVMIEIFTGEVPFRDRSSEMAMVSLIQGQRPERPTHPSFTGDLWSLTQRCWDHDPRLRPDISKTLEILLDLEIPAWKRLITQALSIEERTSLVTAIFSDPSQVRAVIQLSKDDAQSFVDKTHQVFDSLTPHIHAKCLYPLSKICGRHGLLPASLKIPLCYDPTGDPVFHGAYADVWKARYKGQGVAAKSIRLYSRDQIEQLRKRFCREVVVWRTLHHPNVHSLLGVTMTESRLVMVSEWMENGNIVEFTKENPDVPWSRLLEGVAQGLIYLHDFGIVHGDLRGANILIDQVGNPRLTNFGLLLILSDPVTPPSSGSYAHGGAARFISPELMVPQRFGLSNDHPTKASDCYALGMVIYEVISSRAPFHEHPDFVVFAKVLDGERPHRVHGFMDNLWGMLGLCWTPEPNGRPSITEVLQCLEGVPNSQEPQTSPFLPVDEGVFDTSSDLVDGQFF